MMIVLHAAGDGWQQAYRTRLAVIEKYLLKDLFGCCANREKGADVVTWKGKGGSDELRRMSTNLKQENKY